jgi:hypothetical protein
MDGPGLPGPVKLVATGNAGVAALHAAALEPQLFRHVHLKNSLVSYENVVQTHITRRQWQNLVHGALGLYDLPELVATLGDAITIEAPFTAAQQPVGYEPAVMRAALLHRWNFEPDAGSADLVGSAHAVLGGAATVHDGVLDLSANPEGGDTAARGASWAEIPIKETLKNMESGALEIWFTPGEDHSRARLLSCGRDRGRELYIIPEFGAFTRVAAGVRAKERATFPYSTVPLAPGRRHHLVINFFRGPWNRHVILFVNGKAIARDEETALPAEIASFANCYLGRFCGPGGDVPLWNGTIDEVRVYDGPLSPERVREHTAGGPTADHGGP